MISLDLLEKFDVSNELLLCVLEDVGVCVLCLELISELVFCWGYNEDVMVIDKLVDGICKFVVD